MHKNLPPADELPWTISYVIRKRNQIDSFAELDESKRPPDNMIWYGSPEEIEEWFNKVFNKKGKKKAGDPTIEFIIRDDEIE